MPAPPASQPRDGGALPAWHAKQPRSLPAPSRARERPRGRSRWAAARTRALSSGTAFRSALQRFSHPNEELVSSPQSGLGCERVNYQTSLNPPSHRRDLGHTQTVTDTAAAPTFRSCHATDTDKRDVNPSQGKKRHPHTATNNGKNTGPPPGTGGVWAEFSEEDTSYVSVSYKANIGIIIM